MEASGIKDKTDVSPERKVVILLHIIKSEAQAYRKDWKKKMKS